MWRGSRPYFFPSLVWCVFCLFEFLMRANGALSRGNGAPMASMPCTNLIEVLALCEPSKYLLAKFWNPKYSVRVRSCPTKRKCVIMWFWKKKNCSQREVYFCNFKGRSHAVMEGKSVSQWGRLMNSSHLFVLQTVCFSRRHSFWSEASLFTEGNRWWL